MSLTASEIALLKKIVSVAQSLLDKVEEAQDKARSNQTNGSARSRRSGKELIAFRKKLKAERKAGVSVAKLAKRHRVTRSYIYQLG